MLPYAKGARGPEIVRLQIRLKELDLYNKGIDDVFGPGLEAAVRGFQSKNGLPETGVVDQVTLDRLFAGPSPRLAAVQGKPTAYRAFVLTAGFETSEAAPPECFCGLAGNFDGQGISFGLLQWNLGQGTLQPMLKQLFAKEPEFMERTFEDGVPELKQMLARDRAAQLAWAASISDGRKVKEPWRSRFKKLGHSAACQDWQVEAARDRYREAARLSKEYGLWSERGTALMFDIAVQNGSIKADTKKQILEDFAKLPQDLTREQQELERMRIIANRRAEASRPDYVEDVRRRKLTIAEGVGMVHGIGYDLERQYDLRLTPV
jgi:peptidoglycan hydrolase-like protein with peptidoglycan-binding domain